MGLRAGWRKWFLSTSKGETPVQRLYPIPICFTGKGTPRNFYEELEVALETYLIFGGTKHVCISTRMHGDLAVFYDSLAIPFEPFTFKYAPY